jgi:(S)-3,5-dihydroxyphenylglycine transaminase
MMSTIPNLLQCAPCAIGTATLAGAALDARHRELGPGWRLVERHHLEKDFRFRDFREALDFTNRVGDVAEAHGHHPDIALSWGRVRLTIWTHKSDGLTDNDFILAAETDRAFARAAADRTRAPIAAPADDREAPLSALAAPMAPIALREALSTPRLEVMNFLNEVVDEFPDATSFAPGRPCESCIDVQGHLAAIQTFVAACARRDGGGADAAWRSLGHYSRTNGIIEDLICEHLAKDERIVVAPEDIIVTVGAQEAMAILLAGLFDPREDVLLVSDPSYVGITGLASILGIRVVPVPAGDEGLDPEVVEKVIRRASRDGRVRALYDIPDFNNPLGTSLSMERRLELLRVCQRHGVLVIEDNPYGMFAYDHPPRPTLKALDTSANVAYIGSFAKTLVPGLRVGYLVADRRVVGGDTLARALSRVKGLLTVNTSPLMQAAAGGMLLESGGSLRPIVEPKRVQYQQQRDAMVDALRDRFADLAGHVSWRTPAGGFFLPMKLPFDFGPAELRQCALDHGVIVSPMRFFCVGPPRTHEIRLSFSSVSRHEIATGIDRLAAFVRRRLTQERVS